MVVDVDADVSSMMDEWGEGEDMDWGEGEVGIMGSRLEIDFEESRQTGRVDARMQEHFCRSEREDRDAGTMTGWASR